MIRLRLFLIIAAGLAITLAAGGRLNGLYFAGFALAAFALYRFAVLTLRRGAA